jgi:virginiamycin B lyase
MQSKIMLGMTAGLAVMLSQAAPELTQAQGQAALTGQVTSEAEGAMEGVVVSAKKQDSIVMVSVTTDAKGHFSFPEDRLEPGHYTIMTRAVGYDLAGPTTADVAAEKTTNVDLKLKKTANLAHQLTNAEWMMSFPGTDEQKSFLLNCTSCHTLERIARSTHNAEEWMQVIPRMQGYAAVSQPVKPQRMLDTARAGQPEQFRKIGEYLETINLSQVPTWQYELKTLPRPTGTNTRAITTEYSLPRPTIEPHDVIMDAQGNVWYTDFGESYIGKFDPKTLKLTEYPVKEFKPGAPVGLLSLEQDHEGKFWFDTMYQGSLGTIDPKTGEMKFYPLAPEFNDNRVQLNFVGLHHEVDGKVWTKSVGTQDIFRLDLASGKWDKFHPTNSIPGAGPYSIYQVSSDSKNNLWMAEFSEGHLGRIDAKSGEVTWFAPPTLHARARRMEIDAQDRILVTEYRGNKVAEFDPKTEKWTEYQLPPNTNPYRSQVDKNGEIWSSTMQTDRVVRIDPKTGNTVQYLMPKDTNMRSLYLDNSGPRVTFWTGSNHDAALVKVEPLD